MQWQKCAWTDIEALASHREIHSLGERIFVCGHLHALLTVEFCGVEAEALPTQSLIQNRKCAWKITRSDSMKIIILFTT